MAPERPAAQAAVLEQYPDCAFVAVQTQIHAPGWEPLHLNAGCGPALAPAWILPDEPHGTLLGDVPHYGAVMLRRSAYDRVGGYRVEF